MELIYPGNLVEKARRLVRCGIVGEEVVILSRNEDELLMVDDELSLLASEKVLINGVEQSLLESNYFKKGFLVRDLNVVKRFRNKADYLCAYARRAFFESKGVDIILSPETGYKEDFVHHRNSGLNQVLLSLSKGATSTKGGIVRVLRRKKVVVADLRSLRFPNPKGVSQEFLLGRMKQNARYCKKYGIGYELCSFARFPSEIITLTEKKAIKRFLLTGPNSALPESFKEEVLIKGLDNNDVTELVELVENREDDGKEGGKGDDDRVEDSGGEVFC